MSEWLYPWEKLYNACAAAISSAQRPQDRLRSAAWEVSLLLHNAQIPDRKLRERMEQLVATCNSKPSQGEGTLPATTSQMPDDEAGDLLEDVFDMVARVAELKALEAQRLH
jgi:hypothetical protein